MRLSLAGGALSTECDWELCTGLRDNVQHHLEGGFPSGRFPAIHALADRCWSETTVTIGARQLRQELAEVWPVIAHLGIERQAIGIRSRAALTRAPTVPKARGTVLLRLTGWKSPLPLGQARNLGELFGGLVQTLNDFCERVGDKGVIEIGPPYDHLLTRRRHG